MDIVPGVFAAASSVTGVPGGRSSAIPLAGLLCSRSRGTTQQGGASCSTTCDSDSAPATPATPACTPKTPKRTPVVVLQIPRVLSSEAATRAKTE